MSRDRINTGYHGIWHRLIFLGQWTLFFSTSLNYQIINQSVKLFVKPIFLHHNSLFTCYSMFIHLIIYYDKCILIDTDKVFSPTIVKNIFIITWFMNSIIIAPISCMHISLLIQNVFVSSQNVQLLCASPLRITNCEKIRICNNTE